MTAPLDQTKASALEEAGTAYKRATSELYTAAQAAEGGDEARTKTHLDLAKLFADQAKQILDTL